MEQELLNELEGYLSQMVRELRKDLETREAILAELVKC